MPDRRVLLHQTADLAADYLESLPTRPVRARATHEELVSALGGPLPDHGEASGEVVGNLAAAAEPGVVASAGPRYFGFVVGGGLPSALAADWLTSAWDQNGGLYALSPAASVAEEVAAGWLVDLFGLPAGSSVGFSTGATMASFTALAAGRHRVLERAGWNVEEDGLRPTSRSTCRCRCSDSGGIAFTRSRPTSRAGCDRTPFARPSPGSRGRSSCPLNRATSTPVPSTRFRKSSTLFGRCRTHGFTLTAPSGYGPPPRRRSVISSTGSPRPTRGRPTRTSG